MARMKYATIIAGLMALVSCIPSPDNKKEKVDSGIRIVFLSDRNDNFDLWSVRENGEDLTRLTENPGWDWSPRFQQSTQRITYLSESSDTLAIMSMDTEGGGIQAASSQKEENYLITKGGDKIVYIQEVEGWDVR